MSTKLGNSIPKFEPLENLGHPNLLIEWFTESWVKHNNHMVERELVVYEFVDLEFLKKAKISYLEIWAA